MGNMSNQAQTITAPVGRFEVIYTPLVGHATVIVESVLGVRVVEHAEDDPGAYERCLQWANANQ